MNPLLDLSAHPVIAHRGASAYAPENTLSSFELGLKQGADALELDVRVTRDGAPVVVHDEVLDRTTDFTGTVRAHTLADLRQADAGHRFTADGGRTYPYRGAGLRIPTLAEVLWSFPTTPVMVEVKEPEVQDAVRRVLLEERASERCVVASEQAGALELFREEPFACGASGAEISELYWSVMLRRARPWPRYRALSVPLRYKGLPVPTRAFVAAARRYGCPVHVWTINDAATARRLWARGVAGIVTNVPDVVLAARTA
ncbi:MAG TPA: glycerophosphodiester phosphodiesterase [Gemmatimonadales bacterium]|nr:glycerophosphodiester phosphodiesterase [Gemmatimonadales bacterium]